MNYKCMLIDDEPVALDILETYLGRLDGFSVAAKFTSPVKAFEALQNMKIDLIFLDIQMPGLNGLAFIQALRNRPEIILTTAYREFALEGFDLDVADYLLKPVSFERFLKSVGKFQARVDPRIKVDPPQTALVDDTSHILVRADRKQVKILLDEILYLESLKDYVRFVTVSGKIVTKQSISHFEKTLPGERFMRVHRSFIVAHHKITAWSGEGLELGAHNVPIGRQYRQLVEKTLREQAIHPS